MKQLLALTALFGMAQGVLADDGLPAGAIQRGTLANTQLINDAKLGVSQKVASLGCTNLGDVATYVTSLPAGAPGKRSWKELWIVSGCNHKYPVNITFAEDGKGNADWTIS